MSSETVQDQTRSELILKHLETRDLVLKDLGYFNLESIKKTDEKGAFYLSRVKKGTNIYLPDNKSGAAVNIIEHLEKRFSNFSVIDQDILLGEIKLPTRLIAYRLPDEIVSERKRKALKNAKDAHNF